MRQKRYMPARFLLTLALLTAAAVAMPGAALAQDSNFTIGVFGGVGGSDDSEGFTEPSFQIMGSMIWAPKTYTQVRIGQLDMAFEAEASGITGEIDTDLTYITVGTEYRINADYYQSGFVIGLGYYDLDGDAIIGGQRFLIDDDSFGVNIGATGDFKISPRWSFLVELTGHYADFDEAQIFLLGHLGGGYRF